MRWTLANWFAVHWNCLISKRKVRVSPGLSEVMVVLARPLGYLLIRNSIVPVWSGENVSHKSPYIKHTIHRNHTWRTDLSVNFDCGAQLVLRPANSQQGSCRILAIDPNHRSRGCFSYRSETGHFWRSRRGIQKPVAWYRGLQTRSFSIAR